MFTPFTFDWNDPAAVARVVKQLVIMTDICVQLSASLSQAAAQAPAQAALQMRLVTASTGLSLAAEDLRDAAAQLQQLAP